MLAWSPWRRPHQTIAQYDHDKRREALVGAMAASSSCYHCSISPAYRVLELASWDVRPSRLPLSRNTLYGCGAEGLESSPSASSTHLLAIVGVTMIIGCLG